MIGTALAELPALPLHEAGKYVAAAYIVLFALVLIYVAIMALRLSRIEGEIGALLAETEEAQPGGPGRAGHDAGEGQGRDSSPEQESSLAYPVKGHT